MNCWYLIVAAVMVAAVARALQPPATEDEQRERAFIKARGNGYTPLPLPTPPLPDYRS